MLLSPFFGVIFTSSRLFDDVDRAQAVSLSSVLTIADL